MMELYKTHLNHSDHNTTINDWYSTNWYYYL